MIRVRTRSQTIKCFLVIIFVWAGMAGSIGGSQAKKLSRVASPAVPKAWDDQALASLEMPLAVARASPVQVTPDYYYRIPEQRIYKSYPIYAPGKEPGGYIEWLKQQRPEIAFDPAKLKTEEDWIEAGEMVFDAPTAFDFVFAISDMRDPAFYQKTRMPIAKDGTMPFFRYVIREKGKIEVGMISCGMCHTRVMPDGSVIKGAPGNFPADRLNSLSFRQGMSVEEVRAVERSGYGAPWIEPDPLARLERMSVEEIASAHDAIPPGVMARVGTSVFHPVKVPDLIGIKERRYLDHTGLVRHRSIGDLMRYAALNQGMNGLSRYGDFIPDAKDFRTLPAPPELPQRRYSDEQLYALALYLYSLKPPKNPNRFGALAARGKKVFEGEGCATCHTPPLYTNNKLTPVDGFNVRDEHTSKYEIMPISVGTDPDLALRTRRGTGYYKVPSLLGVWYRGPFEHSGSVATLEDWFDPRRLGEDYEPTGFRGFGIKTRAVKGHRFGLTISTGDRRALVAFLKTL
jgi:hypothetical protein